MVDTSSFFAIDKLRLSSQNLKGTNKNRPVLVTNWPSDFFCYCWRIQLVYDYTAPSLECQYLHKSSFIVHLSISAAIFESWRLFQSSTIEQISLFGWHQESHPPTHASHPDNQDNGRAFVFRSFSSRNFDQFVALLFHGLIPNQMEIWNYLLPPRTLWMWVWYPLKWGFKAIQNGNEFQNSFAYCGPDFKCLLVLLLVPSHLANDS